MNECHEEVEYEYGFCPDGGGLMEFPVARAKDDDGNEIIPEKPALTSSNLAALRGRRYAREIADGARRAFNAVKHAVFEPHHDGLVPSQVSCETAQFDRRSAITLGARGDSYYEYLLKHWIHSGRPAGGEAAYLQGEEATSMYVLISGRIRLLQDKEKERVGNGQSTFGPVSYTHLTLPTKA